MCRIVFTRNQKTGLTECSFSFMYRKSPTNANKVHKLIYINNEVQRMSTNIINMYQQTRALVLRGCAQSKSIYTQYRHSYSGYWRRIASRTAVNACGCPLLQRHMYSSMYEGRRWRATPYRRLKPALHADHLASILFV